MNEPVFVIAEAGVNHNGDLDTALRMVDVAAGSGADAVKFQSFKASSLATKRASLVAYQSRSESPGTSQRDMLKVLELSRKDHEVLADRCADREIMFMSTAFDSESLQMLLDLGVTVLKIPSGEITNLPYLREVAATGKRILLSTGMATLEEVASAIHVLESEGADRQKIVVLHCTSSYPTDYKDVNMKALSTMRTKLRLPIGYSDHTLGNEAAIAAVALGAVAIEKHFTLNKSMRGPDHQASLSEKELVDFVESIRNTCLMLGDGIKRPSSTELVTQSLVRRSIVAAVPIKKGEQISADMLLAKRPADGLSPMLWDQIVGSTAHRDYAVDDVIQE